jgi:hypothetical protein
MMAVGGIVTRLCKEKQSFAAVIVGLARILFVVVIVQNRKKRGVDVGYG